MRSLVIFDVRKAPLSGSVALSEKGNGYVAVPAPLNTSLFSRFREPRVHLVASLLKRWLLGTHPYDPRMRFTTWVRSELDDPS
jgi:hypothetical protein